MVQTGLFKIIALSVHNGLFSYCTMGTVGVISGQLLLAKFKTKWSCDRSILWLSFQDENMVSSIFKKQAVVKNGRIKLIKFIPSWCYERNRELKILCRLERDKDKDLRTKVLLGKDDLILGIKRKGENFYKWVSVEHFGVIPGFNFKKTGSPDSSGRGRFGGDENDRSSI